MKRLILASCLTFGLSPAVSVANELPVSQDLLDVMISVAQSHDCTIDRDIATAELLPAGFTKRSMEKTMRYLVKADRAEMASGKFTLKPEDCQE
ncbi:MAG: hypothetical protein AB3N23_09470 [Paracoccaceae bacterium]